MKRRAIRWLCLWSVFASLAGGAGVPPFSAGARAAAPADWLTVLNAYRALARLAPLREDPGASADCRLHARYIVETNTLQHFEDTASPWYTAAGDRAARESDLAASFSTPAPQLAMEQWLSAPFHAFPLLSPRLATVGYGDYTRAPQPSGVNWGGCLNVLRGQNWADGTGVIARWPAPGGVQPLLRGAIWGEYPNPIATCGYQYPIGGMVLLQLAQPISPGASGSLIDGTGQAVAACIYDQHTFTVSDATAQALGRNILAGYNAVVLVPRQPLRPMSTYQVRLTVNGQVYAWQFAAGPGFADLPVTAAAYEPVAQLAARGIIRGYDPATFGPDDATKRAQMAALIARAMGWDAEEHGTAFPDRGPVDADLWRNIGTLAFYGVARGYGDGTYNPTGEVLSQQVILFISRAMVAKGYWALQPDNPALYPNLPGGTDKERADRRDVATYVHYAGDVPDIPAGSRQPFTNWDQPASRAWFARALWQALDKYVGRWVQARVVRATRRGADRCAGATVGGPWPRSSGHS